MPDPQATAEFLSSGLDFAIVPSEAGLLAVCEGEYHARRGQGAVELVRREKFGVERLILGVPPDADLNELGTLLGATRISDTAIAVSEPGGVTVALESMAALELEVPEASVLRPRRMGHVNLKSPNPAETARFFTGVLGLRLSEYIGEALFWMRTDTEHHAVALRPGDHGTVHHLGMEVAGWHSYQPILDHLDSRGYKVEYGPGRHRPGRSLFTYVCDPSSGLRIELYADMVHITDPDAPAIGWEPGDRLTKTLNTWGPTPPQSFLD
ncbi:VOC family protein [Actinomadura sp. SCN-SB]|uniref:VOC family protein n=1 Tax=Actinomadura sp. SCN-SB TaxID=3373092 RepID=UPI003750B738